MMIRFLKRRKKAFSLFFTSVMFLQIACPSAVYALTGGPSQPEVQSFQAAGVTDMVDLFTGDFSYNIPLFELPGPNGGYPFNLSYQAGIGMDQEASWVGLGWNLQPGSITRQMRGLPDEFKGDEIRTKMSIDPSITVGLGAGASVEAFGGVNFGLGFSVYQNSFKGVGYSIDATVGFEKTSKGMTTGLSLGLSLDSDEGVGVNPSLSLGGKIGEFGIGAGYNSKQGLTNVSMSVTANTTVNGKDKLKPGEKKPMDKKVSTHFQSSSSLSLAHPGYTPQITMPMKNLNISATIKGGGSWWGVFGAGYITGFYSEQRLDKDGKWVPSDGYGYLNYQYAGGADVLDFNREKDGMVSKETPNLGIPSLTYDIYSVTGQGISMMYRPMRNDYGIVHDQETSSVSNAIGVGVDVGPAASHVGVNLNVNHGQSTSGKWTDNNLMSPRGVFQKKTSEDLYEPWYFKVHGEAAGDPVNSLSAIGGEKAVRVKLTAAGDVFTANTTLVNKDHAPISSPENSSVNRERKARSGAITPITNEELLTAGGEEVIPYFKVDYINRSNQEVHYSRSALAKHHFAGYTALTGEGLRYVYAIPAYNHTQEEAVFSTLADASTGRVSVASNSQGDPVHTAPGTDKFLKKTILPAYAHSFLLTAIMGPDYVDVTNNGVTKDDLGYWVKFTYQQKNDKLNPYKWRDPYAMAHFQEGWESDPRDNKGSFVYGEKETWYLARAETKSHIAEFITDLRDDGRGVLSPFQTKTDAKGEPVYRLKSIRLYTRAAGPGNPIKVTSFDYDYSLCKGVENNNISGNGKLTLKKLWFEYGNSIRGQSNPYTFTYNNELTATAIPYNINAYDRWGNYKPYPANQPLYNQDFPYAEQDPGKKASIDGNAAAWSLKEITLPSGGQIAIEYESDDYAYVQQKEAMQMTAVADPDPAMPGGSLANQFSISASSLKVRFKLEQPIAGPLSAGQDKKEVLKYIDTRTWQLYFKLYMKLRRSTEGYDEYINGYADINKNEGLMGLEKAVESGPYVYGYFHVLPEGGKHPFSMRAWQHLRTNQPELANTGRELKQTDSPGERINQIKSLGGIGAQIRQMFEGFNDYCDGKGWGKVITADKSWIRLNAPDKIKYGGGIRVKQIAMKDQWAQDYEGVYGQVYEYTLTENGQKISSGVAAYEPIIGGDENALHYAKKYVQSIPMRSDNNLFFEYPVNESYYPGPQVGYRKVSVMSLPSANLNGKALLNLTRPDNKGLLPTGTGVSYGTSGMTVHEFYTAKDFPVITDETEKSNKQFKLAVPIPFVGTLSIVKLAASQGYSIITNDMHGKTKKVSNYRQLKTGQFESEPMSWVKYNYLSEQKVNDKERVSVLLNTLKDNGDGTLSIATPDDDAAPKCYLAQESEFFHDMRQFEDNVWGGGARYNTDVVYIPFFTGWIPIPIPAVWPSIGQSTTQLRTAVSNKIIFRSGILESVEASDEGSLVVTRNLKWDKLTGSAVLTSVNNNFDAPVFSYTLPAYTEYQGMGGAYQNIGLTFTISSVQKDPYKDDLYQFYTSLPEGVLYPGDEILFYDVNSDFVTPLGKVVYMGNYEDDEIIFTEQPLASTDYRCMIVRSGHRNQLSVAAGTITALDNPSKKGPIKTYTKTVSVPK